jgi:ubiquinone biosynthesis protein
VSPREAAESARGAPPDALSSAARVGRAGRTAVAIGRVYLGYKALAWLERRGGRRLASRARARWDESSARALRDTALRLGGLLVKAGQFAGARPDLVPEPFTRWLAPLQDRVPAHPFRVVREVLKSELGAEPEDAFAKLWRRPVASASLAQVHRAQLRDGRDVAVKVQRPEVAALVGADLRNLRSAIGVLERFEGRLGLAELLDHLEDAIPRELDFTREAAAAGRLRAEMAPLERIVIPAVVPELCTRRVLVTEYVPGIRIADRRRLARAGIDGRELVARLVEACARQILVRGFFHADPHPGNLLAVAAKDGARLAFVDFGLVEELSPRARAALLSLALHVAGGDAGAASADLRALGVESAERDGLERTAAWLVELVRRKREGAARGGEDLRHELSTLVHGPAGLRVPPELWLVARVVGLVYGVAAALGVPVDPFGALAKGGMRAAS